MTYDAAPDRDDDKMPYRRCGRSGIKLPEISLGLWQNFGDESPLDVQRAILRRALAGLSASRRPRWPRRAPLA